MNAPGLRILAGSMGFCLWMAGALAWADPIVEVEARYWITDIRSQVQSADGGSSTKIKLGEDLGVKDKNLPDVRVNLNAGPLGRFRLGYTQASLSGDKLVERDIVFDGVPFSAGTRVVTDFEANYLRVGWRWQINLLNIVKLGPILEVKGIWGKTSLESPDTAPPAKETERFSLGLPAVGAALNVTPLDSFDFFAEVSGIPGGDLGYFVDAEAGIKLIPIRFVTIVGGYRVFDIKVEAGRNSARLNLHGPFIGASVRF